MPTRPLTRPLTQPLTRAITAAMSAWNPRALFAANDPGLFYDLNDLSTLFQDSAGTTPVTAAGQPVGRVLDKSGRGNHAFQATAASRPILRQNATTGFNYLEFDGVDDFLVTNSINFTVTDKVTIFTGVRKLSDATVGVVVELSSDSGLTNGTFVLQAPRASSGANYGLVSRGTVAVVAATVGAYAAPISNLITAMSQISAPSIAVRANGNQVAQSITDQGSGNYGNYPLYIGRRGGSSLPFKGNLYSLVIVGKLASDSEISNTERYIAQRTGVTLP